MTRLRAVARDAPILTGTVLLWFGADRQSSHSGLAQVRDVPGLPA